MPMHTSNHNKFWYSTQRCAKLWRRSSRSAALLVILSLVACNSGSLHSAQPGVGNSASVQTTVAGAAIVPPVATTTNPPPTERATHPAQGLPLLPDTATQRARCAADLESLRDAFHHLERFPGVPEQANYLEPLNQLLQQLDNINALASLYANVHPNADMREANEHCQRELSQISTEIGLSNALYQRLKLVEIDALLDAKTKRFVIEMLSDFKRSGVQLAAAEQNQLRHLQERIVELSQDYSRNIREDVRSVTARAQALDGLPPDFISTHPLSAEGHSVITTDYPSFFPVMRYAHNDALRERLYRQFANRGYPSNQQTLLALLQARYLLAQLLGYPDYASYATEKLMIKTPERAQRFIDRIDQLARPRAKQDYRAQLLRLQRQYPRLSAVGEWQRYYIVNLLKEEQHDLDPQLVRQHFPYAQVRDGIFQLVKRLFALEVRPWETPVWHPSVQAYALYENGHPIGNFYLDMQPREGKYKHAAFFSIRSAGREAGGLRQLPLGALVCNFPAPGLGDDAQAFLDHGQVVTFLHEFGHLLHFMLASAQPWSTQAGIRTELDFVEAPSQMLEEWAWDYETLRDFSIGTNRPAISAELVQKMNAARYLAHGTWVRRQGYYAALSLHLYRSNPELLDLDRDMLRLQKQYSPYPHTPDTHFYANFGHLVGYSSNYYTYMWSKVIAADMLAHFQQADTAAERAHTAQRYKELVLQAGGSAPAMELVETFLKRPLNFDAFKNQLSADHSGL